MTRAPAAALLIALSGCVVAPSPQGAPVPGPPALSLRPVTYDSLAGWDQDPVATLLPGLLDQCRRLAQLPVDAALGGAGAAREAGGRAGDWTPFCRAVQLAPGGDGNALRQVIAAWLQPYAVGDRGDTKARFSGYFEPEYPGVLAEDATHGVPVYRRPPDLLTVHAADGSLLTGRAALGHVAPYWTRAQIDRGALSRRGLEIAWLSDPVDLFFLQVQGSGRVRLPSGQIVRLGYAGRNGAAYVPLGRLLVAEGELPPDRVSMQSIRGWLAAHPDRARALMEQNPTYVFFRVLDDIRPDQGPPGALGVALLPMRSLAIDRAFLPLSAPVWVDTSLPDGRRLRRLMLAQDLGAGIDRPARADIFFGWGDVAEAQAGAMRAEGSLVVLLPRPPRS